MFNANQKEMDMQYYKIDLIESALDNFEAQQKIMDKISHQLDIIITHLEKVKKEAKKDA